MTNAENKKEFRWEWEDRDHYQLLEIPRNASREEVKRAFRLQQMVWHPDRVDQGDFRNMVTRRNQAIINAYKELEEPAKRRKYDLLMMPELPAEMAFDDGLQRNPRIWKKMAAWMKDEDVGTPFQRKMVFESGDYLERRRQPSEKQLRYMREGWHTALKAGFDPARSLDDE